MLITCPQCSARLQLETNKLLTRPFNIKCPKCQTLIPVTPPETQTGGLSVTGATVPPPPTALGATKPSLDESKLPKMPAELPASSAASETNLIKALSSLLSSTLAQSTAPSNTEQTRQRRMLLCLGSDEEISKVRSILQGHEYELIVADSSEQAIELLQLSNQVDIVLLNPAFEEDHQGSQAILRFINSLNPAHRRRLFLVMISPTYKTLDTQTAFINNVNLLINSAEITMLPLTLKKGIREFNLLYRSFNEASGLHPF